MSEELVLVAVEIGQHNGFRPGVGGGRRHALAQVLTAGLDPVGHLFQPGRAESGRGRRGPLSLPLGVVKQAQHAPRLPEGGLAAGQLCGDGRQVGGALQHGFQQWRGGGCAAREGNAAPGGAGG